MDIHRRRILLATLVSVRIPRPAPAAIPCRGLNGYALRQCLREKRKADGNEDEIREEYLKIRQFEQPGELVTLSNGLQYREMQIGSDGDAIQSGDLVEIVYIVYRLSSGAYFKYSSGGTPVYMFSKGFGYEGKDDLGDVYRFRFGDVKSLPLAVAVAMEGMKLGGRRRILVPPMYGWVDKTVGPRPDTFGGRRRLEAHKDEPLLFEVELKRVQPSENQDSLGVPSLPSGNSQPFVLPAPPKPM